MSNADLQAPCEFNELPAAQRWPGATAVVEVGGPVEQAGGSR
jgi:hypothetical protein